MRALLPLALTGCSLGTFDYGECTANQQCRDTFGWGEVCGAEGLCEQTEPGPRCEQTWPTDLWDDRDAYADRIPLGIDYDHSDFGLEVLAMRLAVIEANSTGGLDGTQYVLIECDNQEDSRLDDLTQEVANVEVATWLADGIGVPAIMGPATSGRTEAAYLAVEPFGTLVISPSATSPALTDLDGLTSTDADPGLLWRTVPPDSLQGQVIAGDMDERGIETAAVIYETGPYGEGLAEAFYDNFSGSILQLPYYEPGEIGQKVTEVAYSDAEEVLFISSSKDDIVSFFYAAGQIAAFTREDDALGIFLADGAYDQDIIDQVSAYSVLFDQVRGTRPTIEAGRVYDTFSASYAAAFDGKSADDSAFTAYSYDAAWLVIVGSAWSQYQQGSISGLGIARGLRRVSSGSEVDLGPLDWNTAKSSFKLGKSIDVTGASGALDFDSETGETSAPIEVWGIEYSAGGYTFYEITTVYP